MKFIKLKKEKSTRVARPDKVAELEKQGWKKDGKVIGVKVKTVPAKKAVNKSKTAKTVKEK